MVIYVFRCSPCSLVDWIPYSSCLSSVILIPGYIWNHLEGLFNKYLHRTLPIVINSEFGGRRLRVSILFVVLQSTVLYSTLYNGGHSCREEVIYVSMWYVYIQSEENGQLNYLVLIKSILILLNKHMNLELFYAIILRQKQITRYLTFYIHSIFENI
jgi:hypothetical protein